jgi:adenylylsulfate kinase
MIIHITGLPGAGKTLLATELAARVNGIHLNADEIRADLSSDLGFTPEDRIEQARRVGAMARLLDKQGQIVIVDFICPTVETRAAFGNPNFTIWVDRIKESRFPDTDAIWTEPNYTLRLPDNLTLEEEIDATIVSCGLHDWRKPTTLMLGRYQPWHEGHHALLEKAHERTEQVLIAVRDTQGTSEKDPLSYQQVAGHIVSSYANAPFVMKVPNITNIVYGRDVGYKIEQVDLGADIHAISATQKRKEMGI